MVNPQSAIPNPQLPWLIVPLLAIAAFAPTLGMWFVSDDFGHLLIHQSLPFPRVLIAFDNASMFYRPLSTILTWNLGYALFGTNALPYHVISLFLHALTSLFLGRAVAVISNDKRIGWLAGAIFAVYPLCTEPVAWLASQWDLQGAICVAGAVWAFAVAWRSHSRLAYALSLIAAFLAVAMKESTLPLPLVMPFVALATELSPRLSGTGTLSMLPKEWRLLTRRAFLWSLPFFLPSLLFVGLRLYGAGSVGGYPGAPTDFQHFFWDALVTAFTETVMPLNRLVFDLFFIQLVGAFVSGLLLVGLTLWGKRRWPLLVLALLWWLAFVAPVLNLLPATVNNPALENNRVLYLSLMGFSIAVATLVVGLLEEPWARRIGKPALALALLLALPITWIQLQPWVAASNQTRHIVDEMHALIAPLPKSWIDLNAAHLPGDYQGAYVFRNGLDTAMIGFQGQLARVFPSARPDPEHLPAPFTNSNGRYDLDFGFDPQSKLFYISSLAGITGPSDPPQDAARLWDFRQCNDDMPDGWHPNNVTTECQTTVLAVLPTTTDPSLLFTGLDVDLTGKRWVRLGVSVRYPTLNDARVAEWFWQADNDTTWSADKSRRFFLDTTGSQRVYWTYLRASDIGSRLTALRFDPVNDNLNAQLAWISLDVK